jgi:hypothetical protein
MVACESVAASMDVYGVGTVLLDATLWPDWAGRPR